MARRLPSAGSSAGLDEYRAKRDFAQTPEPEPVAAAADGYSFVIQKHAARRLHYDLRLELNGVFKSWAVTKGPSLDPAVKRLAVHVEDHPVAYGDFEGIIPPRQYGSGTVMIWDRGRWEPSGDPVEGYAEGQLSFRLFGERLQGAWTLVRIKNPRSRDDRNNWLLIKSNDAAARPGQGDAELGEEARSVVSDRTMKQIAADADRVWQSGKGEQPGVGKANNRPKLAWPLDLSRLAKRCDSVPAFVEPQLATFVRRVPAGDDWLHEIKYDGYRMQCRIEAGTAILRTRSGLDWSAKFQPVADAAAALPVADALLDGEIVAMLPSGVSSFSRLQDALESGEQQNIFYYLFDALFLDGYDVRELKLEDRKKLLETLISSAAEGPLRYSEHVISSGPTFFENACRLSLEGIVSKRRESPYRPGRGRGWLKSTCVRRDRFTIGGFTLPTAGDAGIGALLVGSEEEGGLRYAGRVGTGFTARVSRDLRQRLQPLAVAQSPFDDVPASARRGVTWVAPRLACEVAFRAWTGEGRLRHASFQGLIE